MKAQTVLSQSSIMKFFNETMMQTSTRQLIKVKARKPTYSNYALINSRPSSLQRIEIVQSIMSIDIETDTTSSSSSLSSPLHPSQSPCSSVIEMQQVHSNHDSNQNLHKLHEDHPLFSVNYRKKRSNVCESLSKIDEHFEEAHSRSRQATIVKKSISKHSKNALHQTQRTERILNPPQQLQPPSTSIYLSSEIQIEENLQDLSKAEQMLALEYVQTANNPHSTDNQSKFSDKHRASLLSASSLLTISSRIGIEVSNQLVLPNSQQQMQPNYTFHPELAIPKKQFQIFQPAQTPISIPTHTNYSTPVALAATSQAEQILTTTTSITMTQNKSRNRQSTHSIEASAVIRPENEKQAVHSVLNQVFNLEPLDPKMIDTFQIVFDKVTEPKNSSTRNRVTSSLTNNSEEPATQSEENKSAEQQQQQKQQQPQQSATNISNISNSNKPSKHARYHNFNKLFMYNILNMFQGRNLNNLQVPEHIHNALLKFITRLKLSAKRNRETTSKHTFDYFSHMHFNLLFLRVTEANLPHLAADPQSVELYAKCFQIDLQKLTATDLDFVYMNIIKAYCFSIFETCINEGEIKTSLENKQDPKRLQALKVIAGIKRLAAGEIISRF